MKKAIRALIMAAIAFALVCVGTAYWIHLLSFKSGYEKALADYGIEVPKV